MPEFDVHLRCTRIFGWDAEEYSRHQLCTILKSRFRLAAAACITHIEAASRGMAFTAISRAPILVCFLQASLGTFVSPMCLVISAIYCSMVRRAMACRSQYNSLQQFCWTALFFCVEEYDPIRYGTSTTPRMLAGHRRCIFNLHLCRRHLNRLFILLSRLHTAYSRASLR